MLYDDHRKLGFEHAKAGMPRHKWTDPHLQEAYDEGFRLYHELDGEVTNYLRARQGLGKKREWLT